MEQQELKKVRRRGKTRMVSKKKGYYMDRSAIERIYNIGPDYKGELFSKDTKEVQEIVFRWGRNRVKKTEPEKDRKLSDYDLKKIQREDELAAKKRGENKYIKQLLRGGNKYRITKAVVNKRYEKIDMRYELGLYPAPYKAFLGMIRKFRARLYG